MTGGASHDREARAQGRRYGIREGAYSAVMQGGGESYLSAFALLLHATPFQIGLLTALPQVVGSWSQILSVKILGLVQNRKPIILAGAAGQALAWLPLLFLPLLVPDYAPWLLIAAAVLYFGMGHLTVPAWNSMLTDLVDPDRRGSYFARRAKITAIVSFTALSAAGLLLTATETWQRPWIGFGAIFLVAAVARLISARYLARINASPMPAAGAPTLGFGEFLRHQRSLNFRHFLLFSGGLHVTASIAGPFFVVYLLKDLHFTYLQYGVWMAAPILGQLMTLKEWGRIGDNFGNKKVLVVTGAIVPFLPMLYLCSTDWIVLSAVNFLGGVTWSGLSLSLGNYVFDAVASEDRPTGVAIYNTVNALSLGAGAMLGSWLAAVLPADLVMAGVTLHLASNLPVVFFISGVLRLIVAMTLLGTFREGRTVIPISHRQLVHELPLIRPLASAFRQNALPARVIPFPTASERIVLRETRRSSSMARRS